MLSIVLVGFISQLIYQPDPGLINGADRPAAAGLDWFGDPKLNLWAILIAASWRHTDYIMVLYLAGLKSVDPSLRDASTVDGANEWQTFRNVIFPTLRPTNVVVLVVTVIEALRAFDIVYVFNGADGLELLSCSSPTTSSASRAASDTARRSASILLLIAIVVIIRYLVATFRRDRCDERRRGNPGARRSSFARRGAAEARGGCTSSSSGAIAILGRSARVGDLHSAAAVRRTGETDTSRSPDTSPSTTTNRSRSRDLPHYYLNTMIVTVPAMLVTLLLSSIVASAVSSFRGSSTWRCCWSSRRATCSRSRSSSPRCTACTC